MSHPSPARVCFNWPAYVRLIRWPSLLFVAVVYGFNAYTAPAMLIDVRHLLPATNLLAAVGGGDIRSAAAWPGLRVFVTLALVAPALLGFALSNIVRAPLQWRHALVLPRARRQLLACHGIVLGVVALGCTLLARRWDPATPAFAVFGLVAAALSFSLPEGNSRARRARIATTATFVVLALAAWFAPELRNWAQSSPLAVGTAALGLAAFSLPASLSTHTLRTTSDRFFVANLGSGFQGYETARRLVARERWSAPKFQGRSWRHGRISHSAWSWLQVGWHEHYGSYSIRRFAASALGCVALAAAVVLALLALLGGLKPSAFPTRDLATMISSLICDPAQIAYPLGYILAMMTTTFFVVSTVGIPLPRWDHVYVLSRDRRARWVHLSAFAHTAQRLLAFASVGLLTAWLASRAAGVDFRPEAPPVFLRAMLGALPFVPLWQWYALAELTRFPILIKILAVSGLIGALILGFYAGVMLGPFLAVLPWLALGIAVSQGLYFWSVRALLRRVDLMTRS